MPTFAIRCRNTPETLSRIVLLLHRKRVQIHSLVASFEKHSDELHIEVEIEVEEARAILVEANLYKLVDVMTVERRESKQADGLRRRSSLRER